MTAISDRPQLLPEEFGEFARGLAATAEGIRPEFINGKPGVKPVPDGDHGLIIEWLMRICIQSRPELWPNDQGLKVETLPRRPRAPRRHAVHLLIDRDSAEVIVHSQPDGLRYGTVQTLPFGRSVRLPDPVGIALDTEPLKNWVR